MAPRSGRGKPKGEKKKKEGKILPLAMDITVNLPDQSQVVLKGISTDRIIDVRRLLRANTNTCNITNYSLSHEVRGPRLKDSFDVAALKPCVLTLVEEDYDEDRAVEHVRRLLDIVACTTSFGPAAPPTKDASPSPETKGTKSRTGSAAKSRTDRGPQQQQPQPAVATKDTAAAAAAAEAEMSGAASRVDAFYEFFSLSNLPPPLQFIRRSTKQRIDEERLSDDHIFSLEVKISNGKLVLVDVRAKGFYSVGKQRILCHNLVDLLRQLSRAFDNAYEDLMKAFSERNKFGNLPYGYRANTWLVPPLAAQSPSSFPPLPAEDESWGGNGGGWGRDGKSDTRPWASDFYFLKSMPCKTAEERQIRDRKAFLLHSLFVDVAIFRAIKAIQHVVGKPCSVVLEDEILHSERVGDLTITVTKDASDASRKVDTKIDGKRTMKMDSECLAERNLLKGITADENTAAHDVTTLGVVNVRHSGYNAVVKIEGNGTVSLLQSLNIDDQPEGGANALNVNSLRMLLHKGPASERGKTTNHLKGSEHEQINAAQGFVKRVLEESLSKLQKAEVNQDTFTRWELGACWIQHLQEQKTAEKDKKQSGDNDKKKSFQKIKNGSKIEGLGKPLRVLNNAKNKSDGKKNETVPEDGRSHEVGHEGDKPHFMESPGATNVTENEVVLKQLLPDPAFVRLKESGTGLHCKVKLSEKLSHVQSLCIHEMIARAFKHILRAVIAAVIDAKDLGVSIAMALNLMLGVPASEEDGRAANVDSLVWTWLVGIELAPRDYNLDSLSPFQTIDIISLVPVHKTAASYHAIAIALSLMEAYQLSVQHEQTTLQILQTKLGSDDLRTQDAAAWLEYFESKAFEQQEAARNGTRKPDASIASKGHLSVSDLLDYINPNQGTKGKDAEAVKRRHLRAKIKGNSSQNVTLADSDGSQEDSPAMASDEEKQVNEPRHSQEDDQANSLVVEYKHDEVKTEQQIDTFNEIPQGDNVETEDGWKPVQRPRSGGHSSQTLKQKHANIGKVINYQKKAVTTETDQSKAGNYYSDSRYFLIIKSVAYRIKSMSSSSSSTLVDRSKNGGELSNFSLDFQATSEVTDHPARNNQIPAPCVSPGSNAIVSLGKSPSYKDVALAPPGTISKAQLWISKEYEPVNRDASTEKCATEANESTIPKNSVEDVAAHGSPEGLHVLDNHDGVHDPIFHTDEYVEVVEKEEEQKTRIESDDDPSDTATPATEVIASGIILEGAEPGYNSLVVEEGQLLSTGIWSGEDAEPVDIPEEQLNSSTVLFNSVHMENEDSICNLPNGEHFENTTLITVEADSTSISITHGEHLSKVDTDENGSDDSKEIQSPMSGDGWDFPNKKLSASATPFNPTPTVVRGPVPVTPWPINIPLHLGPSPVISTVTPICTSPHHSYPPSPRPPSILHPLPFMYPPYSLPQPVPTSNFALNSSIYHPNQMAWCNVNPIASEFVPRTVWPGCHPVDFTVMPPVVNPISEPIVEPKGHSDNFQA
ncbi:hypothetical protein QJS10_CPB12g00851 [Acorus calamus]|uniref:Clu domain-containing protein n=1 Tax=Acorus calamus TaxID=4465 RepID=A0AAV9DQG2_ACOCL|nr:hypothetical protein QJS10_CPB12g00851 [Acorus calamus]